MTDPFSQAPSAQASALRVAYLTGDFPMISHTFILREILALRGGGVEVLTCSIRKPPASAVLGEDENDAYRETFYIIEQAKHPVRLLAAHVAMLGQSPRRWLSALAAAWRMRPDGFRSLLWQMFYFLEAGVLARHLEQAGAQHLHNHFADSSCTVAMLASIMSGIPFSFTVHGPSEFFEPKRWALGQKTSRASFVACISHFARSQVMLFSPQGDWSKLAVVHCGVDPKRYGRRPRGSYGKRVLFVGRLVAVKGVPLLLDSIASLRGRHPDLRLTIVGDGQDRAALEARAAALGIIGHVRFAGSQSQDAVAALLDEHDVLVLPSFAEGVPIVLMEAMASRLPVVCSGVAGVPELVENGVSGFIVPPGDLGSLTSRLDDLLSHPELCAHMGAAGRAKVEAEFTIQGQALQLAELFAASSRPAGVPAEATVASLDRAS